MGRAKAVCSHDPNNQDFEGVQNTWAPFEWPGIELLSLLSTTHFAMDL